jgi:aryl-alcohol dehydrogenase-like predicted oxidoreductase
MIGKRKMSKGGPLVGALGYGAMVLEGYYGASDDDEAIRTIHRALDAGMTMIDSADAYGNGRNEGLVGRAVRGRRNAFVASKFGIVFEPTETGTDLPTGWGFSLKINGRPDYVNRALDASLRRLGVEAIDLWYLHYPDPAAPTRSTRSPRCSTSTRCGAGRRRQSCCPLCASWASPSWRGRHLAPAS